MHNWRLILTNNPQLAIINTSSAPQCCTGGVSLQLIGRLMCDTVRGSEIYGFAYDDEWLAHYGDIMLSDDLHRYPGVQYTRPGRDIFACFSDALPDRWGRTLLKRREQPRASLTT